MTAAAAVLGRREDGSRRRYSVEPESHLLHVVATKTGHLAYCGYHPVDVLIPRDLDHARAIESCTAPETVGLILCATCRDERTSRPDPEIWRP